MRLARALIVLCVAAVLGCVCAEAFLSRKEKKALEKLEGGFRQVFDAHLDLVFANSASRQEFKKRKMRLYHEAAAGKPIQGSYPDAVDRYQFCHDFCTTYHNTASPDAAERRMAESLGCDRKQPSFAEVANVVPDDATALRRYAVVLDMDRPCSRQMDIKSFCDRYDHVLWSSARERGQSREAAELPAFEDKHRRFCGGGRG